ncbi:unnamed protein product [Darwinula stevensoni]|uniref:Protein-serine O-palmitoleoyltransferase porcupine n=1 Tax=Darwinula stevensoni TaxID=69355 RepID=A0A7R8X0I8_9CRUS|nr:unnamed protein product [Darwinula stevensoni]CAG0881195.1 unnamed protein product [Darwinula stevensoni]
MDEDEYVESEWPDDSQATYDFQNFPSYSDEDGQYGDEDFSILDIAIHCVLPTARDALFHFGQVLIYCFLFRFSTQILTLPGAAVHFFSSSLGLILLWNFFEVQVIYFIIVATVAYVCLFVSSRFKRESSGIICASICIPLVVYCELKLAEPSDWHMIRGAQMLLLMKVISVGFDLDSGKISSFLNPLEFMGYIFHVGSAIFGPWISYEDYCKTLHRPPFNFSWVVKILKSSVLAFTFLSISTCWSEVFGWYFTWRWALAYRDALSFRASHYFVSYMSEASVVASGVGADKSGSWNAVTVTRPRYIEFPRSLVEVVVHWNVPMHQWLKTYVFKTTRRYGRLIAILITYAASSMLHGLNFQIWAVLLSLGFYTYIEYMLRLKLASIYGAPILANPNAKEATDAYKWWHPWILAINCGFMLLNVAHLAYLGLIDRAQGEGFNLEESSGLANTLTKWASLDFLSHWYALVMYGFYALI